MVLSLIYPKIVQIRLRTGRDYNNCKVVAVGLFEKLRLTAAIAGDPCRFETPLKFYKSNIIVLFYRCDRNMQFMHTFQGSKDCCFKSF